MCHFSTGKIYISTQSSANEQKYLWPTQMWKIQIDVHFECIQ